jgi:hypothetical protein
VTTGSKRARKNARKAAARVLASKRGQKRIEPGYCRKKGAPEPIPAPFLFGLKTSQATIWIDYIAACRTLAKGEI